MKPAYGEISTWVLKCYRLTSVQKGGYRRKREDHRLSLKREPESQQDEYKTVEEGRVWQELGRRKDVACALTVSPDQYQHEAT